MASVRERKPNHVQIAQLLIDPSVTQKQVAEKAGVSVRTVARVADKLREGASEQADELQEYLKRVRERLTHEVRVDAIERSMADVRFALPAVKYADQLLGLAPKQDEEPADSERRGPMFVLPAGTEAIMFLRQAGLSQATEQPETCVNGQIEGNASEPAAASLASDAREPADMPDDPQSKLPGL